jgi:hypothetical protein
VKYAFIQDCRLWSGLSLNRLLPLFETFTSGYYGWLKRVLSKRDQDNCKLDAQISRVFDEHEGRYGHRRINVETHGAWCALWLT